MVLAQPERGEQTELHGRTDIVPVWEIDESPVVVVARRATAPQCGVIVSRPGHSLAPSAATPVTTPHLRQGLAHGR